jgi:AcrR family transcriptional regulator
MAKVSEEKIIAAAKQVFLRYGYRRATMGDLAEAAKMSRPALYLVFPSKEDVLTAVVTRLFAETLDEIRRGLDRFPTPKEKLTFVFDTWCVRGYEMVQASPDAKDLLESSYQFATKVTTKAAAEFVAVLAEILEPLVKKQSRVHLSSVQIAQMLAGAMLGLKGIAQNARQLRELLADLITVVLASLQQMQNSQARSRRPRKRT